MQYNIFKSRDVEYAWIHLNAFPQVGKSTV